MRTQINLVSAGIGLVVLLLAGTPAIAHHSWTSEYDGSKQVEVQGVVTEIEWTNPHVHVYVDSTDENGAVKSWNFEMASVLSLERGGWSRRTLQVGDRITVGGFGGRAVTERAIAGSIETSDGRALFVGNLGD